MEMIERPLYMQRLRMWKEKDVIKVVTGVRRCGKSTLLALYARELQQEGVSSEQIITINLEQLENESLLDYHQLHDEILNRLTPHKMNYVFIDEVQNVPNFQKALDSLYTRENIDLYITGSNALLLEGTLATLLSGRFVEISLLPLSFEEYVLAQSSSASLQRQYTTYIEKGGFPATQDFLDNSLALHDYLEGILNTVLLKDVAQRLRISNTLALEGLVRFLYDNIGNLVSIKNISDTLKVNGISLAPNTVASYVSALMNTYIVYEAKRFDVKGKRILKMQAKYYAVDMGMRKLLLANQVRDKGRILENLVFLELMRRYGSVYVGQIGNKEIDFVVEDENGFQYFQVAESVVQESTLARELAAFDAIKDNNPKTLLTLDDTNPVSYDGILHYNALDWFLSRPNLLH